MHSPNDWSLLVKELGPKLYRYFLAFVPAPTASDLVQETLIRLVKKVRGGEYQPEQGPMGAYAFGIARWVRMERFREEAKFSALELTEEFGLESLEPAPDLSDRSAHLRWAICRLKPVEQEIIARLIDSECGLEEISKDLRIPLGTVKSHVHRAKISLKEIMGVKV